MEKLSKKSGLKIGHLNVNGLKSKLPEVCLLLHTVNFDIFAITETHLSSSIPNEEINIDGYHLVRTDRKKKKGGGTMIYYKENLNVIEMNISASYESTWIDITIKSQHLLIGCIYRPPDFKSFLTVFEKSLTEICIKRKNILLLGDFNYNINDTKSSNIISFKELLFTHNLKNLILEPTRVTSTTSSTIDLILTSMNQNGPKITSSGTFDTGISDHHIVYTTTNTFFPRKKAPLIKTVFKLENPDIMKRDFELIPWQILEIFDDIDDVAYLWHTLYTETIQNHLKVLKLKKRANNKPWIDKNMRKELNKRYRLLTKAKYTKDPIDWTEYKQQRNKCTRLLHIAEANHWKNTFDSCDSTKSFWKAVNTYKGKFSSKYIGTIVKDDVRHSLDADKANVLNTHFTSVGTLLNTNSTSDNSHIYRITPLANELVINKSIYEKAFNSIIKNGKASGPDNIKSDHIKIIGPQLSGLYNVIKCSVKEYKFPSIWKIGKVTCLHKKGSKADCNNYRPITLLSSASKVLEKVILDQLTSHLNTHNLITEHQWGFRSGRSTESILLKLTESWHKAYDNGKVIACLFIDFKKAFDVVPHNTLLKKLQACGISGNLFDILKSYLHGRKQFTVVNGIRSKNNYVKSGVPQGSLLGPQLFSIDINDLPENIDDCETDMFADDTTCHSICDDFAEAFAKISNILKQLESWANINGFSIHTDIGKTEIMFISRTSFIGPIPSFCLNAKEINVTNSVKCLGITIDNKLSWGLHVNKLCRDFKIKLKNLYKMRYLDQLHLKEIYFKAILPPIFYCMAIWSGCSNSLLNNVNSIHIKAARFIQRIKKGIPDSEVLLHANWHSIEWYCKRRVVTITHKLFNETDPNKDIIVKKPITRNLRNNLQIVKDKFKYMKYKRSFNYRCATLWNKLPDNLKQLNLSEFKSNISRNYDVLDRIDLS